MFQTFQPQTYYIRSYPPLPEVTYDWANHVNVSKHADARVIRAKHRYAKRRRNR
jgi:hypothetical protein